jgi:threonine synthase
MLPINPRISLGEGGTPYRRLTLAGLKVHVKMEHLNPTGSFKDRGTALAISHAVTVKATSVVEDTSGNTGVSVAAYASAAGIRARIFVPHDAPLGKKLLMKLLGAEIVETASRSEAAAKVLSEAKHSYYVAHTWNPLYIEGAKTIALEAFEEGFQGQAVAAPVGSGGLILGLYRGFNQLAELGLGNPVALVAVQGASVYPVCAKLGVRPKGGESSELADGIRVANPPRLEEIVKAVRESGGCCVVVSDREIAIALKKLVLMGFIVEPTSAAALAGLEKAVMEGCLDRGDEVLLPLTGSGLKMLSVLERAVRLA